MGLLVLQASRLTNSIRYIVETDHVQPGRCCHVTQKYATSAWEAIIRESLCILVTNSHSLLPAAELLAHRIWLVPWL